MSQAASVAALSGQVWAMVQLQRLTGMRPHDLVTLRSRDIEIHGDLTFYRPGSHKTEHHDVDREIVLGPQSQAIVRQWLRPELGAYLFCPA